VPAPPSIRRLSLAALDQPALEELVRHGEDLLVERKQDLPKAPRFGAAAGSLANTLGGWILLGVADNGTVPGWAKPERLDLQSHLGSIIGAQVDPLPPFVAEMREVDGRPIAVIRVFASADVPHIVRGTGAVYVRSSKGKEPVDDHRTLLELARRGEEAEALARRRLVELSAVGYALRPPDWRPPGVVFADEVDVRYIARAAPLTVTPAFSEWPLTRRAADSLIAMADVLLPPPQPRRMPFERHAPAIAPFARGAVVTAAQQTGIDRPDSVTLVADSGGVLGVAVARGVAGDRPVVLLQEMLEDELKPIARAIADLLRQAEAYGRVAVDLWMVLPSSAMVREQQIENVPRELYVARELTVPANEDDVDALALSWHRELQRAMGIVKYEDDQTH
jgi:Putative DNA-binding domain